MSEISYQSAVEQIKNSLDIVETISKYVVLKKSGHNYMGLCPFHNEKTPSFVVTPSKQIFKCFGCGAGGDVLTFLMKYHNQNFSEVVQEQANILGIELPRGLSADKIEQSKKEKDTLLSAVNTAMKFYHNNLLNNKGALEYLEKRGVGEVAITKFRLGLAPNSNDALACELKKEFTKEELLDAGLVSEKEGRIFDRFKNRIIIPIFDTYDSPVAFGARAIMDGQNPKYLNSPDSKIYNKSSILYGLNSAKDAIKEADSVIIMEGYFDVISAQVNGVKNTVASCGTALTPQHIKLLSRYTQSRRIYLAFDSDNAGRKAVKNGGEVIKQIFANLGNIKQYDSNYTDASSNVCEIRVVPQIGGKDPDEIIREFGAEGYIEQVKNSPLYIDYTLEQAFEQMTPDMTPQEKGSIVHQIAEILVEIKNPVILAEYIKNSAFRIKVDEHILRKQIKLLQSETFIKTDSEANRKVAKVVDNSASSRHKRMEENLVKLGLVASTPEKKVYFQQLISGYKALDSLNFDLLRAIDKLLCEVNNNSELAKKIILEFCNDTDIQKQVVNFIYSSNEYEKLTYQEYTQAMCETFERLNNIEKEIEKEKIRNKFMSQDLSEKEKIEISKEIYEKYTLQN